MKEMEEKHETCDGCQMFSESGCMLDDSCPECVEHHLWTSKAKQIIKPNEDCDAEYFFCKWFDINSIPKHNMILPGHGICELMEEYHKQKLRSELIAYDKWLSRRFWDSNIPTPEGVIDEYLKQKK